MNTKKIFKIYSIAFLMLFGSLFAENIDPYEGDAQYGWGENIGWLNFEPSEGPGVQVEGDKLTGFVWAENIGWITLSCEMTAYCGTVNFGVANDGFSNLSGFAWAENVGWINFDPDVPGDTTNQYKVTIGSDGKLSGWAWGENIGWFHFDETQSWNVRACVITLDDLCNFASYWLQSGDVPSNLDGTDPVDMKDFGIFASWWQDFCPDGWPLK
jgi:hypothetical protein